MQILRIHIENFGKLHDFDMEFREGLNHINAANGWGKSTLAAFLKAVFYGLEATTRRSLKENERKKYLPWQGGAFGGSVEFSAGERCYRAERFFGMKEREDTFCLYDLVTGLPSSDYTERLGEELFRLDRSAFERSSYFAQQDFSVTVNDSMNARLTRVEEEAGDMQNYEKACISLENRMKYYRKLGNRGRIPELQEMIRRLQEELENCRFKEKNLEEQKRMMAQKESQDQKLQQEIRAAEEQIQAKNGQAALDAHRERLESLKEEAQGRADILRETQEKLEAFEPAPPEEEELDQCQRLIIKLQEVTRGIDGEMSRARELDRRAEELRREGKREKTGIKFWLPAGGILLAGIAALARGPLIPGLVLAVSGILLLLMAAAKEWQKKEQRQKKARELHEIGKQHTELLESCRKLQEQEGTLREEIKGILMVDPVQEDDEHALEEALQKERKRSRRYGELLRDYGIQKKEAGKSRMAYEQFRDGLLPEELARMHQPSVTVQEKADLERKLRMMQEQRKTLQKEIGHIQNQIQNLSGEAERIPELEKETERLKGELEASEREHRLLGTTLQYLKEARNRFSSRYLECLQQNFLHYLKALDPEGESEPILDVKLQVKIPKGGAARELAYFSAGEQDLIRIAERFAVVDALYEKEQPVLILDDPFVNLDPERYERALAFIKEMSKRRQMIYFTCRG